MTNSVGGLLSFNITVDAVDPAIDQSMLDKTYSLITYSHDLNNLSCTFSNSDQIDHLGPNHQIDPIYAKIKKMSDRFNTPQVKDANLSLQLKHKQNNDIK